MTPATTSPIILKRQLRALTKHLRDLTDAVVIHVAGVDNACAKRKDIPDDIGRWLAKNVNALEMVNDSARYSGLRVDFRKDNKAKALKLALKRQGAK